MPPFRLARLTEQQFSKIETLENEIGLTLVAYEPAAEINGQAAQDVGQAQASSAFLDPAPDELPL